MKVAEAKGAAEEAAKWDKEQLRLREENDQELVWKVISKCPEALTVELVVKKNNWILKKSMKFVDFL